MNAAETPQTASDEDRRVPFEEHSELMMWFAVSFDARMRNTVATLNADLQRVI
jgi:hypothetical protein